MPKNNKIKRKIYDCVDMSAKLFTWLDLLDSFVAPHLFTTVLLLSAHFFPGLPGALESLWATAATGVFELHRFSKRRCHST